MELQQLERHSVAGGGEGDGQGHPRKATETSRERATRLSVWISQRMKMHRYDLRGETAH